MTRAIGAWILAATAALAQVTFPSLNSSPWLGQELVGRVAATSAVVNVVLDKDARVYVEFGAAPASYESKTETQTAAAGVPVNVTLSGLTPNTRYYYRLQYAIGSGAFTPRAEHTFLTQRTRGAAFTFAVQADPHLDNNSSADVYQLTLANELADKPDFLIDLGDTMMSDKLDAAGVPVNGGARPNSAGILTRTQLLRSYYDIATHSVPLFLALGNHEGEWGSNLDGTPNNMAIWDTRHRTGYFPNPAPDGFFTGDTRQYDSNGSECAGGANCALGQRRSYYAWEWGDALFLVLDPFWSQTAGVAQPGSGQDCCRRNAGYWSLTLGSAQYEWLKQTLEKSTATYKFVFSHNLVGGVNPSVNGVDQGPMRGGVEAARYLEWGGDNLDGTYGFSTYRPSWAMPIHRLLVANHVTAFFHGHDHLYAHQTLDGISYQAVPQPSAVNANLGSRARDYGYTQGTLLGGRGYLRVSVAPAGVKVEYVETWLPSEQRGNQTNRMVADSYTLTPPTAEQAPAISSVYNAAGGAAIAPNAWVEIKGAGLATTTRTWQGSDFNGGQMPTQLDGVSVTIGGKPAYVYYISPAQVNVLAPPDPLPVLAPAVVTVNGTSSQPFNAPAQAASPAFFTFDGTNAAATHIDGSLVGPATLYPGSSTPARPGETIVLYGTRFGATSTPVVPGSAQQSGALSPLPTISVGGVQATVQFGGLVFPGEYQFNVVVPPGTPNGNQPVTATIGGRSTPAGVVIAVQQTGPVSTFTLTSPAGSNGGAMSADYTCDGTGSTPALAWTNPPAGTKEFALLMTTLPGDGTTKWNWVLYNIPGSLRNLAKDSFLIGTAGVGSDGPGTVYNPPCSQGPGAKVYTLTLYALSSAPAFSVPAEQVTGKMVSDAIEGVTLGKATLNLSYTRTNTGSSAACVMVRDSTRASKSGTATVNCDNTYAYVGSIGIPTGPNLPIMMNGITSTNLQIPIPQNFQGANGWKIPLAPALAATPTNVVDGPIGVAINGVPIFNPCTQGGQNCATTGDTKAIGQLDVCNGHAGRADDYHYHAAPICMMADQPANYWNTHPLGWALDGFAIFGYNDADGSVAARDSVCGGNSKAAPNAPAGYAYHVIDSYPYVTNCLAGTPSPDLPNQASKYRPLRQPPVTPFNVSGMTLSTDADGYRVLQFSSSIAFTSTENGNDQYRNPAGTYRIRYKQVTGDALAALLAQRPNTSACWSFQFLNSNNAESQPPVNYCR
ncbi:MAG: YHYH protein [Bryobacteraceae bacterium]